MGKPKKDDISGGIEVLSIGKLYNGAWDKKYWSASRGKYRYPYPIGYKLVRTQNGITYTVEVLEGVKGPLFQISSDGKSCSGDTPEIAWESFQKKGSSKLLHPKRLSCKIDGVEFFGFKDRLVLKLLRELAANVGATAEQTLLTSKFSGGVCETDHQLQGKPSNLDPDLQTNLFKSHAKGKRSRNDQVVSRRGLDDTQFKQLQQEECTKNIGSSTSKQGDQSSSRSTDLSTSATENHFPGVCYAAGALGPDKCVPIAESLSEEKKLTRSLAHIGLDIDNLHNQEYSGRSSNLKAHESNKRIPEDSDEASKPQHDIPVACYSDLCAADTLHHPGDSSFIYSQKENVHVDLTEKNAIFDSVEKSEVLVADSLPQDEVITSSNFANSENCDADSVGDEIAKSMMTILLPRAVPLLKTFSRKRKKSNPSKTERSLSQKISDFPIISQSTIARGLAEHPDLQRKNDKASIPCSGRESDVCTSGNLDSVVPDSFDTYNYHDLLPHADADHSGQLSCGLCPPSQLPIDGEAETNQLLCHQGNSKHNTGTADLTLMAVEDTESPAPEFTANSKQDRLSYRSIDNISSMRTSTENRTSTPASISGRSSFDNCYPKKAAEKFGRVTNSIDCDSSSLNLLIPSTSCDSLTGTIKMFDDSRSNIKPKLKLNNKLQGLGLFACYIHPLPISVVQLVVKENEIFTCVKCGNSDYKEDTLFVYKVPKKGEKMGCPSLIGHVPMTSQISQNIGRDIASEMSLLQLTPAGESLVLANSIKVPYCREGKMHCLCTACTSDAFEKNAVKIVRLNSGYASLVTRLKTAKGVCCLLVCEPSFLLAAEEGGRLKLWVMNSNWREPKEDWYLPTFDGMLPCIVELKTVPNSVCLVIGHNGFGEFGIWDIEKRNLVSRFSSSGMSVLECIPVGVFRWQRKGEYKTEALVAEVMDATKMCFPGRSDDHVFLPEDKDVAAWLLISTASDPDHEYQQSSEQEEANVGGCWRLALLVNNMVIAGSTLDRGVAAATSFGHGVMGSYDGQVYMWELSSGKKLGNLHTFKGGRVSCFATDTSNSGALAIASEEQLLVYLPL